MPRIQKPGTTVALPKTGASTSGLSTVPLDIASGPAKALGEVGKAIGGIGDMAQKAMFRLEQQNDQDAKMIYNTASLKDDAERLEWFNKIKASPPEDRLSLITQAGKAFTERLNYTDLKNIDEEGFGLYYSEKAAELSDSPYVRRAQAIYEVERGIKDKKFREGVAILQTEARQAMFVKQGKETQTQILLDLNNGTTYDTIEDAALALDSKLDNLSTFTDKQGNVHSTVSDSIVDELKEDLSKSLILDYAGQQLRELNVPFAQELATGLYDKMLLNAYDNSNTKVDAIKNKAQRIVDNQAVRDLKGLHEADYMKDPEGERAKIQAGKEPEHIKESAIADLEAIVARDNRDEQRRWQDQRDDAAKYLIPGSPEYDIEKARDKYVASDLPNEEIARKVKELNSGAETKTDPEIYKYLDEQVMLINKNTPDHVIDVIREEVSEAYGENITRDDYDRFNKRIEKASKDSDPLSSDNFKSLKGVIKDLHKAKWYFTDEAIERAMKTKDEINDMSDEEASEYTRQTQIDLADSIFKRDEEIRKSEQWVLDNPNKNVKEYYEQYIKPAEEEAKEKEVSGWLENVWRNISPVSGIVEPFLPREKQIETTPESVKKTKTTPIEPLPERNEGESLNDYLLRVKE